MSKVNSIETAPAGPLAQIVNDATAPHTVTASNGKKITMKRPGPWAQFAMVQAIGDNNERFLQMCAPLLFVTEIDGEPVYLPKSEREVQALVERLGEPGYEAIMNGLVEHFGGGTDPLAHQEAVKK